MTQTDRLSRLRVMRESDPQDADIAYMIAQECAKAGDLEGSLTSYDACLALDPNYHYAYFHKARVHERLECIDDAIRTLREGLGIAQADNNAKAIGEIEQYLTLLEDQAS